MTTATLCIACHERETDGGLQCAVCLSGTRESTAPAERTTSADPLEASVTEAERQAEGIAAMQAAGWKVYRIGQYNAERTQDAGPADTVCFHEARRLAVWVEWKRPHGGVQSEAQAEFQRLCEVVGWRYVLASQVSEVEQLHREGGNG